MKICRYTPADKSRWDAFVATSKNATFLHLRDYMDYHADRFDDWSLMAFNDKGKLVALLPANKSGDTLWSHQGLTYGGWLTQVKHFNGNNMLDIFEAMRAYLRAEGFTRLVYKAIPHIYHKYPAEEDLYALFVNGARVWATNLSSATMQGDRLAPFNRRAGRVAELAERSGVTAGASGDYAAFWKILSDNLMTKYDAHPVHSLSEIELLHSRFPDRIKLYMSYVGHEPVAGVVMFDMGQVVHAQYSSANAKGSACGALGYLFGKLVAETYRDRACFDFGTSNEDNGRFLNRNLIEMKSGYGARGIAYQIYELDL